MSLTLEARTISQCRRNQWLNCVSHVCFTQVGKGPTYYEGNYSSNVSKLGQIHGVSLKGDQNYQCSSAHHRMWKGKFYSEFTYTLDNSVLSSLHFRHDWIKMSEERIKVHSLEENPQQYLDNWFARNVTTLNAVMRIIFGIIWEIDGALKFQLGMTDAMAKMISSLSAVQPSWLVTLVQFLKCRSLVRTLRSLYILRCLGNSDFIWSNLRICSKNNIHGFFLSWSSYLVSSQGLWRPIGPGATDIGTGIVYALVSIFLLLLNGTFGTSWYSSW